MVAVGLAGTCHFARPDALKVNTIDIKHSSTYGKRENRGYYTAWPG